MAILSIVRRHGPSCAAECCRVQIPASKDSIQAKASRIQSPGPRSIDQQNCIVWCGSDSPQIHALCVHPLHPRPDSHALPGSSLRSQSPLPLALIVSRPPQVQQHSDGIGEALVVTLLRSCAGGRVGARRRSRHLARGPPPCRCVQESHILARKGPVPARVPQACQQYAEFRVRGEVAAHPAHPA